MSVINKIISNGIGTIFLKTSPLILNIYIARNYSNEVYSEYIILISTIVLFGTSYLNTNSQYLSGLKDDKNILISAYTHWISYLILVMIFLYFTETLYFSSILTIIIISSITPKIGDLYRKKEHKKYSKICFTSFCFLISTLLTATIFEESVKSENLIYLYLLPYLTIVILLIINKENDIIIEENKNLRMKQLKQMSILTLSAMIVPFGYWFIYNKMGDVIGTTNIALFASILQWTFIFSQLSMVISNVLISYLKDSNISININIYLSWTIASVLVSNLIIFEEVHSFIFGINYDVKDIIIPFILVQTVIIINSVKSYVYRLIIVSEKNHLTLLSNIIWVLSFTLQLHFSDIVTIYSLCKYYLYSTLISLFLLIPFYYINFKSELVILNNKKSYFLLLYYLISVIIAVNTFHNIINITLLIITTLGLFYFLRYKEVE